MYLSRHLEGAVKYASAYYPVVMVCGQRQVGKSTMLNHLRDRTRRYVTLDDANARRLATEDPALFFETYGTPLLIDEFQRAPGILLEMKRIVDGKILNGEDANGLFWLTGSQKFRMMQGVSESLAGRIAILDMSSLSNAEISGAPEALFDPRIDALKSRLEKRPKKGLHEIYATIFRGGMPKLLTTDLDRERFYMDYVNTYLERDVKDLSQVGKINEFYSFLVYMAARTGQELKYDDIAKRIGISAPTAKAWVTILERSGIVFPLRPYFSNQTKRLVKTPKVYFLDTGLAAYLCRWTSPETLENGAMDGAFLETYVVSEIVKSYYNAGKPLNLYYYRDIDKKEIDLLIVRDDTVYPIEIKKAKTPKDADKNFSVLEKLHLKIGPGLIFCMTDELIPYNRDAWYCPIAVI